MMLIFDFSNTGAKNRLVPREYMSVLSSLFFYLSPFYKKVILFVA